MGSGQSKPTLSTAAPISAAPASPIQADATTNASDVAVKAPESSGGCPVKLADGSYPSMSGFTSFFRHPPIDKKPEATTSATAAATKDTTSESPKQSSRPVQGPARSKALSLFLRSGPGPGGDTTTKPQQYDVYSRPLKMDPTNNMPLANPDNLARNALPSKEQTVSLPTERVSSTIPKGGTDGETWTYPSPQMFWNSLARKGKLGDTKEEDMETVVAIHNNMNEGTWTKVLEWEEVIGEGAPKLSRFMGRPHDLSPKAFIKHHLLSHPLPFDRHDWTVVRPSGQEVRYVIDYYHDTALEKDDTSVEDLQIGRGGKVNSLLVDVRPAVDGPSELWARMVSMPLAIRGCASIVDCILGGGEGKEKKSEFEPLPMMPSDTLKQSMEESKRIWESIQKSAKEIVEEGKVCDSNEMEATITEADAKKMAESYATILKNCQDVKTQLKNCGSDAECNKAFMGMTICAGKVLCPLQHKSFAETLEGVGGGKELDEMATAKINIAFQNLGECVAGCDQKAGAAKKQYPDLFEKIVGK